MVQDAGTISSLPSQKYVGVWSPCSNNTKKTAGYSPGVPINDIKPIFELMACCSLVGVNEVAASALESPKLWVRSTDEGRVVLVGTTFSRNIFLSDELQCSQIYMAACLLRGAILYLRDGGEGFVGEHVPTLPFQAPLGLQKCSVSSSCHAEHWEPQGHGTEPVG